MESVIDIRHLRKSFGAHEVLKDIDFSVGKGEVACIIGSSGSGKSTLLRCINLLETPDAGEILFHGKNVLSETCLLATTTPAWAWCFSSSTSLTT